MGENEAADSIDVDSTLKNHPCLLLQLQKSGKRTVERYGISPLQLIHGTVGYEPT